MFDSLVKSAFRAPAAKVPAAALPTPVIDILSFGGDSAKSQDDHSSKDNS
ncbi:MAG: hypothetical protein V7719_09715 [Psychroserpens sp.]